MGFVGLGAMGQLIVPRLMAAGHKVTGWNRSRDKAAAADRRRHGLGRHAARGRRSNPRSCSPSSPTPRRCAPSRSARTASSPACKRGGIYIDMSTIEPDESRAVAAEFAKAGSIMLDGPLSGSPVTVDAGQRLDHDRRRRGGLRARQTGAARHRPEGDAHRRQRPRLPDEDRRQPAADGRGDRLRRSGGAGRKRRRRARGRARRHPQERRRLAGARLSRARSFSTARCRRCRSPT